MEILLESLSAGADPGKSAIHIRYWAKEADSGSDWWNAVKTNIPSAGADETGGNESIVIIRRPYEFLSPAISSLFETARDVRVIVDRRFHDRRRGIGGSVENDRRTTTKDRRRSSPILDIFVPVEA